MDDVRYLVPPVDPSHKGAMSQIGRGRYVEGQVWTLLPGFDTDALAAALDEVVWGSFQDVITTPTVEVLKVFDERGNADERMVVWLHQPSDDFHVRRPLHTGRVATLTRGIMDAMFELVIGPRVVDVDAVEVELASLKRRIALLEPLNPITLSAEYKAAWEEPGV